MTQILLTIFFSDVESLKKGIIKTPNKDPHTILLVGEVGVGKSSVLEFIANVFTGNDVGHYNFDFLDGANEQGGSGNHSRTTAVRLYKFTSKNGRVVSTSDVERHEY